MFLVNPLLTEMLMLAEKYHISFYDMENMNYDEYLEILNFSSNMSQIQNKQMNKK